MDLHECLRVVSEIRNVDPEMSLPELHCFLLIANEEEGMSLTDVAGKAGVPLATASRYIGKLGQIDRFYKPGLGLVDSREDPRERRKKIISVTDKGKELISKLNGDYYANLSKR